MWVDEEGVAHTVALPKPQQLMTTSFRRARDELLHSHRTRLDELLAEAEDALLTEGALAPDEPEVRAHFEGRPPPVKVLRGEPETPEDLAEAIGQVEARWRLDAVLALQDYVD
jgi:hypothetical protein